MPNSKKQSSKAINEEQLLLCKVYAETLGKYGKVADLKSAVHNLFLRTYEIRKRICFYALFVVVIVVGVACSSNQEIIDQAVQLTVEAQQGDTKQTDQENANQIESDEFEDSSESAPGESQSSLADSILGKWSGDPGLSVPGMMIDSTYSFESFTFYKDIVIFRGEDGRKNAFFYNFVDENTVELVYSAQGKIGTLQITQSSQESLILTLVYSDEPDKFYESSELNKVANIEEADVPSSLLEAILGKWNSEIEGVDISVEFIAGSMALATLGEDPDFELYRYEFEEPTYLALNNLRYPDEQPTTAEIAMPNEDTLFLWFIHTFEDQKIVEFYGVMHRDAGPWPVTERPANEVLYPFQVRDYQCGYIDIHGNVVIEPRFGECGDFVEGLAPVSPFHSPYENGSINYWGYIDNSGDFVIEPQFRTAYYFSEGLAHVRDLTSGNVGYIDKTGNYIIPPQYDNGDSFSEGLVHVQTHDPQWSGYIDKTGTVVFEVAEDYGAEFHDGLVRVDEGYIDKTGQIVISLNRTKGYFSEGLAAISSSESSGCYYINTQGNTVIQTDFHGCSDFSEGLAAVFQRDPFRCGYINRSGDVVIDLQFEEQCLDFSEGYAILAGFDFDSYGYIDTKGEYIFGPIALSFAREFNNGLARIGIDERWGYIDKNGNYVLEP